MSLLAISEAFQAAVDDINARCDAAGVDHIGHDVCKIAAYHQFETSYMRTLDKLVHMSPEQQAKLENQFNREAVACARLWICRAILTPARVRENIAEDLAEVA
jgi:hypothetical protein